MSSIASNRAPASPDNINLAIVGGALLRKFPALLLIAGLAGAGTAAVLSTMAPKYLSQVQLEIRGNGNNDLAGRPDKEAVGTHVRGLMSTELALKMAQSLNLTKRADFNSALEPEDLYGRLWRTIGIGGAKTGETDEDRLMQAYFKSVRAYQVRDTRSVIVDCTTSNAKFSADCANTLAELYRDSLRGRTVTENTDVRAKLEPQVARLTREVADAEALATEFRGKANLFQGGAQATLLKEQQLGELTAELTRAATARSDAEARATAAREMSARGIAAANPDVQKSTLIPRMEEQRITLERQISELSATLLRGHPRMKQLSSELSGLQAQIRAEVQKVVESLGNDARIAADREKGVRLRLDEMKRTVVSSAPDTAKLAQLENQAKAKRSELDRLQRQYETAASSAGAAVSSVEVEIVSRAYASNEKVFPKIGSMAALAAFAAFILSLAIVLTRELVHSARPLEGRAPTPVKIATDATPTIAVPLAAAAVRAPIRPAKRHTEDVAAEIAMLAQSTRGFRVLMATSVDNSDAASDALALARALSVGKRRVVLVGWAGCGDTLAHAASIDARIGTVQLLAGESSLEATAIRLAGSTLDLIPAGEGVAVAIDGDGAGMVLDTLDEIYDIIIVYAQTSIATDLFVAIQGRFDAGLVMSENADAVHENGEGRPFLGFEVPDFPVLVLTRPFASDTSREPKTLPRRRPAQAGLAI